MRCKRKDLNSSLKGASHDVQCDAFGTLSSKCTDIDTASYPAPYRIKIKVSTIWDFGTIWAVSNDL